MVTNIGLHKVRQCLILPICFLGYSENRLVDIIPFVGAGVGRTMSHNLYATGLSAGVQASFRLSKLMRLYAEAGWNRYER